MPRVLLAVLVLCAVLGALFFAGGLGAERGAQTRAFTFEPIGLRFDYPAKYFVEVQNLGDGHRAHFALVLYEDTPENRTLIEYPKSVPPREGPPTITIDIFQNNLDASDTEGWVRGSNDSNFKLSPDSVLSPARVGGEAGLRYRWSGLYEGESVAVARPDNIYMFSVTYLSPEDPIRGGFEALLSTVAFPPVK